jgi:hypothetical protein
MKWLVFDLASLFFDTTEVALVTRRHRVVGICLLFSTAKNFSIYTAFSQEMSLLKDLVKSR